MWGDCGHPTALQEGKWGAIVILGSARAGAGLTWIGQMAKHTQHVGSLRELGLDQRGILEETAFLQQDSTEGTAVRPSTCAQSLGQLPWLLWVLPSVLSHCSVNALWFCFLPRRATASPWFVATVGAQRHLLHPFPDCAGVLCPARL